MSDEVDRRRRIRKQVLGLTLFVLAVYVVFIITFANRSQ
jgi:hypothetical protein